MFLHYIAATTNIADGAPIESLESLFLDEGRILINLNSTHDIPCSNYTDYIRLFLHFLFICKLSPSSCLMIEVKELKPTRSARCYFY